MCGIFGMIRKDGGAKNRVLKETEALFQLTEPRGRQASGLALACENTISIYKRPKTANLMLKEPLFRCYFRDSYLNKYRSGPVALLGHCRLVTDGTELDIRNNQPVQTSETVGVHNGVVNNQLEIKKAHAFKPQGNCDSEVFFELIQSRLKQNKSPNLAVHEAYGELEGSAAIGLLYRNYQGLTIATNFGSLYYAIENRGNFMVFASEELIVKNFLRRFRYKSEIVKLDPNKGVTFNLRTLATTNFQLRKKEISSLFTLPREYDFIETEVTPKAKQRLQIIEKGPSPKNLKRCKRCILPENYPFLSFDENGVCSHCHKYEKQKIRGKDELEKLLSRYRSNNGEPDCIVGLSGGRDSSYGLHVLKTEFGMNPIGMSYDWLLTSRKARHNIAKVTGALGVEVIYRCGNYERQAENIRKNIFAFLKNPDLGMMTFVQAGDKEMYHYGRKVRKEVGVNLTVWCSGYQLEQREFFIGYCGIDKTLKDNPRLYGLGWGTKARLGMYYAIKTLTHPSYINSSILDNALAFWHCFVAKDDFLYLFNYYPWDEKKIEEALKTHYKWEADKDFGENQWRMDDFHTSFINYVYYTVGGFSEFDDFRSNQIREGLISRQEAMELVERDNQARLTSLRQFSELVGFNLEHVLKRIDAIPKRYS